MFTELLSLKKGISPEVYNIERHISPYIAKPWACELKGITYTQTLTGTLRSTYTKMKSKTSQDQETEIPLPGHRVSSLLYTLASDDQPLQGKKVFINPANGSEVSSSLSPICSHSLWHKTRWGYSSQFLYGNYFALMGAGIAVIFLSWLDYHPLFKIWNWIKSVSQGQ